MSATTLKSYKVLSNGVPVLIYQLNRLVNKMIKKKKSCFQEKNMPYEIGFIKADSRIGSEVDQWLIARASPV